MMYQLQISGFLEIKIMSGTKELRNENSTYFEYDLLIPVIIGMIRQQK